MADPVVQVVAGVFVFAIPIAIVAVIYEGWKIFATLLSSPSTEQERDKQASEEENLEYIERHFGRVRID